MDDKNLNNKKTEKIGTDDKDQELIDNESEKVNEEEIASEEKNDLGKELEDLKNLADGFEVSYKRALADYQNLQRRTQEERINLIKSANQNLILKLLPVLDTLILAVKHFNDSGLNMTIDQFIKVFEDEGLKKIKTVGEKFNPETMEAVTTREGEDGIVLEELRIGFENIRPAQVTVGKAKMSEVEGSI